MPDTPPRSSSTGPPDTSSRYAEQDIVSALQAIESHTREMALVMPNQASKIGDQIAQRYNSGPSTPTSGKNADVGPSAGASVGGSDALGGPFSWLHYPGTRPTPLDYFQMFSGGASQLAQGSINRQLRSSLQNSTDPSLSGYSINRQGSVIDASGNTVALEDLPNQDLAAELQQIQEGGTRASGLLTGASDTFQNLAKGYVTGRKLQGLLQDVTKPFHAAMNLGYTTGASGGSAGPLGLRLRWDPGVQAGISQFANRLGFSFSNDVTPSQASTIYGQLYQNGWLGGPTTNRMRQAAGQIMQWNPALGSQPQMYSMMDETTRMGTASLQQFVGIMKQVPDAMQASHVSMTQTLADWQQIGQATKQQGGTFYQGMQLGNAWQQITGLPGASMLPLLNNPMVQGQSFLQTGLLPWEQGLQAPGSRISSIMGAIGLMHNIVGNRAPLTQQLAGGFSKTVSGNAQTFALMSHFLGVDSSTLQNLYSHRQGITAGSNLWDETDAWKAAAWRPGANPSDLLKSNTTSGNWGAIRKGLHQAMYLGNDGKAHYMFSPKDIQAITDVQRKDVDAYSAHTFRAPGFSGPLHASDLTWQHRHVSLSQLRNNVAMGAKGSLASGLYHVGDQTYFHSYQSNHDHPTNTLVPHGALFKMSQAQIKAMESGKGPVPKDLARKITADRSAMIKHDLSQHTGSSSNSPGGSNVTISLSKAAQKMFKLSDPTAQGKAANNAGSVNTSTNPWANGPTYPPTPDLNTADNYPQYNTGAAYNPTGNSSP